MKSKNALRSIQYTILQCTNSCKLSTEMYIGTNSHYSDFCYKKITYIKAENHWGPQAPRLPKSP
ncbi:hypothetical protein T07_4761 [Trichinella nelsoni]|uniref:Uncharacterized protein n=1 Tax=Trichinella nelsoni TaxID=6336 RepID=A0A0V0SIJ8_9BILA|nr:hypothetical protein T07_4761 [Trichinella nelsoni]